MDFRPIISLFILLEPQNQNSFTNYTKVLLKELKKISRKQTKVPYLLSVTRESFPQRMIVVNSLLQASLQRLMKRSFPDLTDQKYISAPGLQ